MEELLEELLEECRPYTGQSKVATSIPELAKGNPKHLGVYILRSDGKHYQAGDYKKLFTIQRVIKPILLAGADGHRRWTTRATAWPVSSIRSGCLNGCI